MIDGGGNDFLDATCLRTTEMTLAGNCISTRVFRPLTDSTVSATWLHVQQLFSKITFFEGIIQTSRSNVLL